MKARVVYSLGSGSFASVRLRGCRLCWRDGVLGIHGVRVARRSIVHAPREWFVPTVITKRVTRYGRSTERAAK